MPAQNNTQVARSIEISPGIYISLVVPVDHPINTGPFGALHTGEDFLTAMVELAAVGLTHQQGVGMTERLSKLYEKYHLTPMPGETKPHLIETILPDGNPLLPD